MFTMSLRIALGGALRSCALAAAPVYGQARKGKPAPPPAASVPQKMDEEYTKLIKEYLQDPRISTELVDHMPASDTDRKSTRLNSSHLGISYAVFCLKK